MTWRIILFGVAGAGAGGLPRGRALYAGISAERRAGRRRLHDPRARRGRAGADRCARGKRAVVVGHDWGASVAYAVAVRSPSAVEKLVALSIPHPAPLAGDPTVLWKASHFLEYQLPGLEWWLSTPGLCHIDTA